jgi:hypothetical protein
LPFPTLATTFFTSGWRARTPSTYRTARSVSPRLAPSGASIDTENCGIPAFGKRLKPILGTSARLPAKSRAATARVRPGRAMARASTGR